METMELQANQGGWAPASTAIERARQARSNAVQLQEQSRLLCASATEAALRSNAARTRLLSHRHRS